MEFKLPFTITRPIVGIDTETTGTNVATDRIVQLSAIKIMPDGSANARNMILDPEMPIPKNASDIHGISDAVIAELKAKGKVYTFKEAAPNIYKFLSGCDLLTFNGNHFDIPLLAQEFFRAGIETFPEQGTKSLDPSVIFKKMEERTLSAALKFYCGETLENAHDAMPDTIAAIKVLIGQVNKYEHLQGMTVDQLHVESSYNPNAVDLAGNIVLDEKGVPIINFGKHKGKPVLSTLATDKGYYNWMQNNMTADTLKHIKRILLNK